MSGVYAFRGGTPVPFESTLERDFIRRAEFFTNVTEIVPQPVKVPYRNREGRAGLYTPDFFVLRRFDSWDQGRQPLPLPQLIEVKPEEQWRRHWREWLPKWKAAWRFARERDWEFHICDESRIRDLAFHNIRDLEPYRRMQFVERDSRRLVDTVREKGIASLSCVLDHHFATGERATGAAHIRHLIAMRRLVCDIGLEIDDSTELWVDDDER